MRYLSLLILFIFVVAAAPTTAQNIPQGWIAWQYGGTLGDPLDSYHAETYQPFTAFDLAPDSEMIYIAAGDTGILQLAPDGYLEVLHPTEIDPVLDVIAAENNAVWLNDGTTLHALDGASTLALESEKPARVIWVYRKELSEYEMYLYDENIIWSAANPDFKIDLPKNTRTATAALVNEKVQFYVGGRFDHLLIYDAAGDLLHDIPLPVAEISTMDVDSEGNLYVFASGETGGTIYKLAPDGEILAKAGDPQLDDQSRLMPGYLNPLDEHTMLRVTSAGDVIVINSNAVSTQAACFRFE